MTAKRAEKQKNQYMAGCVFLGLLALVFVLNALILFPFQRAARIPEIGISDMESARKRWFLLENGDYSVNGAFETESQRSSSIPFLSKHFVYYNVTVKSTSGDSDDYIMAVRVKEKKAQRIERGETVKLYGMISKLNGDLSDKQRQALNGQLTKIVSVCLNDNGNTTVTRALSSFLCTVLAVICVYLAIKVYHHR